MSFNPWSKFSLTIIKPKKWLDQELAAYTQKISQRGQPPETRKKLPAFFFSCKERRDVLTFMAGVSDKI